MLYGTVTETCSARTQSLRDSPSPLCLGHVNGPGEAISSPAGCCAFLGSDNRDTGSRRGTRQVSYIPLRAESNRAQLRSPRPSGHGQAQDGQRPAGWHSTLLPGVGTGGGRHPGADSAVRLSSADGSPATTIPVPPSPGTRGAGGGAGDRTVQAGRSDCILVCKARGMCPPLRASHRGEDKGRQTHLALP